MRSAAAAGLDSIRVLGRRPWGAVEGGDTGCGSHLLAAVAGVAVAGGVAISGPARPTLSTTLCGCAHLARTRAAGPTRSWSASGREGERRQRCLRKRHPAGIRRLHIVVVAAVAAAADVVASEAASGHAGSRPWRAIKAGVSVSGWAALVVACTDPATDKLMSDGRGESARGGIAIKSGEGGWASGHELTRHSVSTATRQLPPTGSPVIVLQIFVRLSSEEKI
jgi:hypothetical protein